MEPIELFKDLVWDGLKKEALRRLFIAVPVLAFGPIKFILTWVISIFADKLFEAVHLAVDLETIRIVNAEHLAAYQRSSAVLKIIARDKGIDSPEFQKAKENAIDNLSKFVRFS